MDDTLLHPNLLTNNEIISVIREVSELETNLFID